MTTTIALTGARQQTRSIRRPHPLLAVLTWELRRFRGSRLFWVQALGFFCFLVLVTWVEAMTNQVGVLNGAGVPTGANAFIPGTSAWGLLVNLPTTQVLLVVLLPFVSADGVARDLQRRTHELLMSAALPSWAYVWGRYLIGLLMSLGLAALLLAAILGVGTVLHLTVANYPAPELGTVLVLWVGMVVPASVLISSLGFAIVTLFPLLSMAVKIVLLVAWVVGTLVVPGLIHLSAGPNALPTGYSAWDPTSAVTAHTLLQHHYQLDFGPQNPLPATAAQFQQLLNSMANKPPDVSAWLAPHLIEAVLSLVLVAVAALGFRRFRNTSGA
jgi:ABC-type transport system involved in multi-copper enzyme maturation permease subunit